MAARVHLFRLQILIIDGGLLVLRNLLDQSLNAKGISLDICLQNEMPTIKHLSKLGIITKAQNDILFPSSGKVPTTSDLDITLTICLLRNLKFFGLYKKFNWKTAPQSSDVSLEADIWRLKDYRNYLCHIPSTTVVQETDFRTWWTDIEQILGRLNPSQALNIQQTIDDFKACPLDVEEEERIQKEIKKWEDCEARVDRLTEKLKKIQEDLSGVKEDVDGMKQDVSRVKQNISGVKQDISGVKQDVNGVKQDVSGVKQDVKGVKRDISGVKQDVSGVKQDVEDLKRRQDDADKIRGAITSTKEEIYQERRKELKESLIKFYKDKRSTVPLSPLIQEVETNLAGFYVMPDMVFVKQKSLNDEEERIRVRSLRDLLMTGNDDQQNIYLSADAGFGKTSFSKYLAITWAHAYFPDNYTDCFKDEELKALGNFEFLFLVLLRDTRTVCTIDEMIEQQIIKKLPPLDSQYPLQEVLRNEKCLIILDGLDEWAHPDNGCPDQNEQIPHRYARDNCVILTTTRPWKLGVSNLKTSDINKKVELVNLSQNSTSQLEKNVIRKMSGINDDDELEEKTWEFDEVIEGHGLEHMQTIPLLLMYITCLWCNKVPIGNSKVEVHINILEFLLSRTAQKYPEIHPSFEPSDSDIPELFKKNTCHEHNCPKPYCGKHTHKFCRKFYSLLTALAELAFHTLFNVKRENTLVFDVSVAEKYLKADDMKLSLLSGILTGSTTTTYVDRTSKVSFSHKTVQEFFSALFISSQSDAQKTFLEKCRNVQSILDMSIICEFISKMNSKMMCEICLGFTSVLNEDEKTCSYRTRTHVYNLSIEPLYNIQKMLVSCSKEMSESENIKLCLQDFFINFDTVHVEYLQLMLKLNKPNTKSLFINMEYISSNLRQIMMLFSLSDLDNLQKLYYRGVHEEKADLSVLLFPSLQTVTLLCATLTSIGENFCEKLETLKNVQYLDLGDLKLSHKQLETIFNFISANVSVKELRLKELSCEEHGDDCERHFDLSIKHSQLKKLVLWELPALKLNMTSRTLVDATLSYINLDESSLLLSRDMLNIEKVVFGDIELSAKSLRDFIYVVEDLPQPVRVELRGCDIKPRTEYKHVSNYIRSSQTFVVVHGDCRENERRVFEFQTSIKKRSPIPESSTTTTTTGSLSSKQENKVKNRNKKCCIIN